MVWLPPKEIPKSAATREVKQSDARVRENFIFGVVVGGKDVGCWRWNAV